MGRRVQVFCGIALAAKKKFAGQWKADEKCNTWKGRVTYSFFEQNLAQGIEQTPKLDKRPPKRDVLCLDRRLAKEMFHAWQTLYVVVVVTQSHAAMTAMRRLSL